MIALKRIAHRINSAKAGLLQLGMRWVRREAARDDFSDSSRIGGAEDGADIVRGAHVVENEVKWLGERFDQPWRIARVCVAVPAARCRDALSTQQVPNVVRCTTGRHEQRLPCGVFW